MMMAASTLFAQSTLRVDALHVWRYKNFMQIGPFTKLIARVYGIEEKTVTVYARFLREAGLLTTGARGVNAPHMLPLDAARMTIALLATDKPSQAVELVARYGAMKLRANETTENLPEYLFHDDPTFEQVMVRIFASGPGEGAFDKAPYVEIRRYDKSARFELTGGLKAVFRGPKSKRPLEDLRDHMGLKRICGLASLDLMPVQAAIWTDRAEALDASGFADRCEAAGLPRLSRLDAIMQHVRDNSPDWFKGA